MQTADDFELFWDDDNKTHVTGEFDLSIGNNVKVNVDGSNPQGNFSASAVDEKVFIGCHLKHGDFNDTEFMNCEFHDAVFEDCLLEMSIFSRCTFNGLSIVNSDIDHISFRECIANNLKFVGKNDLPT